MSITLDEINILVWNYLLENGFSHTAFLFESESLINSSNVQQDQICPNSLVNILQNSLKYMKIEKPINHCRENENSKLFKKIKNLEIMFPEKEETNEDKNESDKGKLLNAEFLEQPIQLTPDVACVLISHRSSVFCCKWSPNAEKLATAGEDSTIILWDFKDDISTHHEIIGKPETQTFDSGISCIDWDFTGRFIAAGTLDANIKIYSSSGFCITNLKFHSNNVFVVKFNPAATYLASAGADRKVVIWDVSTFSKIQDFEFHKDTIIDLTWKDDFTFVTASADHTIGICSIKNSNYIILNYRNGSVTSVAYNPSRTCLASGSEDSTICLWRNNYQDSFILRGHTAAVSLVQWVPGNDYILVSSSLDGTIKIWDTIQNACIHTIQCHQKDIFAISCSPNGKYIVSGSNDSTIVVSSIYEGKKILTFTGNSDVYDVQFDRTGKYIAATFEDSTVVVIPFYKYIND